MKNEVLVSVVVVTYNSADYVIETLESIKAQTYEDIELVVSDDCSIDATVLLVEEWISLNKSRFVKTIFLKSELNEGVSKNLNKGVEAASGKFTKTLAGDDLLVDDCIQRNIDYINDNKDEEINFVFSNAEMFDSESKCIIGTMQKYNYNRYFKWDAKKQYIRLLKEYYIPGVTMFVNTKLFLDIGGYSSKYFFLEDYPFWLKATSKGHKLYYFEQITVKYRIHNNSITRNKSETGIIYNRHKQDLFKFIEKDIMIRLKEEKEYLYYYSKKLDLILFEHIIKKGNVDNNYYIKLFIRQAIDPIFLINKVKSLFNKLYVDRKIKV